MVAALLGVVPTTPATAVATVAAGVDACASAPQRTYNVSAINVRITYDRFGDNDPLGFMYVLNGRLAAVRAEEAARTVSGGLRKDAIQPLVIRANLGDCLVLNFTNRLTAGLDATGQPTSAPKASIHAHGLPYQITSAGSNVGRNPDSTAAPGQTLTYRLYIDPDGGEGGHVFHSHGDDRQQQAHGLFGAIVAEPAGSAFIDPETGAPGLKSGWEAIIQPPTGVAFREFALLYHEVGDEAFNVRDAQGVELPKSDPLSGAYRPGSRALNYRSEPFLRRLELSPDKSQTYSSYHFGDPATPIARSYLGEPTKTRVLHAGSEMSHVHHVHGGATRWRRNPGADDTDIAGGLRKTPIQSATSIRLDSQTISSGESYNLEHECGAGGCQQVAGDFLFHCHIAQHYVAGMWGVWRVFDTAQPDLATIPGRPPAPTAVTSAGLIGRTIEGRTIVAAADLTDPGTQRSVDDLVEAQLPPPGARLDDDDATVWDWVKTGPADAPIYKGEPDDTAVWPNYASATPGVRPQILFNPANGRYTWPMFRPHLGKRPPFSPNGHSGAPWLGDTADTTRPDGLCPAGAPVRHYNLTAITRPVAETDSPGGVDADGQVFVLNQDRESVVAGTKPVVPLAIRSNVGDCVALTLASQLADNPENGQHSKVNMHTHFVQFDPQASDGVITGFSYEQSVRPFAEENRVLVTPAVAGAPVVTVSSTARLRPGIAVAIGLGEESIEVRRITAVDAVAGTLAFDQPLSSAHGAGQAVSVEFVQSRWFSDVDSGTVFFHDHVDGINSWDHGLFGAHVIEPPGSTYHDPVTGAEARSGAIVDIHTSGSVGAGQSGSFREFVLWLQNDLRGTGNAPGDISGGINLRAEPFADRSGAGPGGLNVDPYVLSSVKHGDPATPLPRAYVGDPFVIRTIGLVEKEGALRVTGHRFRPERFAATGELTDAATTGISERFDYVLDGGAGGPAGKAGDFLYYSTVQRELEDGAWGIIRVHDTAQPGLQPLPARAPPAGSGFPQLSVTGGPPPATTAPGQPCPLGAPSRLHAVTIFAKPLPVGNGLGSVTDPAGVVYSLSADEAAILAGTKPLEPLAIRANAGECIEVHLTNHLAERASLGMAKVAFDPQGSSGAAVGLNPDSTVAPGDTRSYRFYADRELGTSVFLNLANTQTLLHGAYGVLIVEPPGSTYVDSITGRTAQSGLRVNVNSPVGSFREMVSLLSDADRQLGQSVMPYPQQVGDFSNLNYRQEPLSARLLANSQPSKVFTSSVHGDPDTTLMRAYAGDPVRFRIAVPAAQQFHSFALEGHRFPWEPEMAGSALLDARTLGPGESLDAHIQGGAGGTLHVPGDYIYQDHRMPFTRAGLWGIFRVHGASEPDLVPLGTVADDVVNTGFRGPTTSSAALGGDGDGFETDSTAAGADGGAAAVDVDSGTGTSGKCSSTAKDRHEFSGYGFALPAGATVRGIKVRLDASADTTAGSPAMCVELSGDGGATWTPARRTSTLGTAEAKVTLGGSVDLWGASWFPSQLTDVNFRIRVTNVAGTTDRDFFLDWAAVKVTYE